AYPQPISLGGLAAIIERRRTGEPREKRRERRVRQAREDLENIQLAYDVIFAPKGVDRHRNQSGNSVSDWYRRKEKKLSHGRDKIAIHRGHMNSNVNWLGRDVDTGWPGEPVRRNDFGTGAQLRRVQGNDS